MSGWFTGGDRVEIAFWTHPRRGFLPPEVRARASRDRPLPLGHGQTNSQPTTVRMLLRWLDAHPGDHVLDVGSGSGWTTALLSSMVGPGGRVDAVERIPALVDMGRRHCDRAGLDNVAFHLAGEALGLPDVGPFDRILVSAAADHLPGELVAQVRPGGRLVVPVAHDVQVVTVQEQAATGSGDDVTTMATVDASNEDGVTIDVHRGFRFVPLIT